MQLALRKTAPRFAKRDKNYGGKNREFPNSGEPLRRTAVSRAMTANPNNLGADATFPPELLHETNYAIEVLEKEFPKINRAKIAQAIGNARSNSAPTADRWQILQEARRLLSDR